MHDSYLFLGFSNTMEVTSLCDEYSSNPSFHLCDSWLVLLDQFIMTFHVICVPICLGHAFVFDPDDDLGVIPFLMMASALGRVLTWISLIYETTLRNECYYVFVDLKRDSGFSKYRANEDLHMRLCPKSHRV